MSQESLLFRFQKCWQANEPQVIFQFSPARRPDEGYPGKFYLILDARQESFLARVSRDKPDMTITAQAAFAALVRKYLDGAIFVDMLLHQNSGDVWCKFFLPGKQETWWIKLAKSRPPELVLMDGQREGFIRYGQKGTFTKRRPYEGDHPDDGGTVYSSVLEQYWDSLRRADARHPDDPRHPDELRHPEQSEGSESEEADDVSEEPAHLSDEQRALVKRLRRRVKTLKKTLQKTRDEIPSPTLVKETKDHARLLQNYLYRVTVGSFELHLTTDETGEEKDVVIPLQPEWSPGKNLEELFTQVKRLEKAQRLQTEMAEKIAKELSQTEGDIERLTKDAMSSAERGEIAAEHGIAPQHATKRKPEPEAAKPYRVFSSSLGHSLFVGKGARDNDALTKQAKANDYWFHTVGVTGSHIIVPAEKAIREQLPEKTKREAAILAIHYSSLRGDLAGEVYFTRKSNIRKKKGMPDGLWLVERSESFFVRYTPEELQAILERQSR